MEAAALAAITVAASAASAGAAIYSGHQQAKGARYAAEAQAAQYEEERRAAQLAAEQEEAAKRRDLNRVLSAGDALRSGRGLDLGSQTDDALRRASIEGVEADIDTIQANADRGGRRLGLAADAARVRGSNEASTAIVGGYSRAIGSLASGAAQGYDIMRRAGT